MTYKPCTLATLYDPDEFSTIIAFIDCFLLSAARSKSIDTHMVLIYEAQSHSGFPCGSCAFLPTLKPNLTTSAPRLDTDCWLGFVRLGVSPSYVYDTELAH